MTEKEKILESRKKLDVFFQVNSKSTEFIVDCELPRRIKFIYSVIFPNGRKYLFYLRFIISRIAKFIDYSPVKVFLYRIVGIKIGKGVFISPDVNIDVHFPQLIEIEDYAILGFGASLFTHDFFENRYRLGRIKIGKGATIGAFCIIDCGVEIAPMASTRANKLIFTDVLK